MTPLTTRARELAARERNLYDQTTIPAVLEELADEVERLTGEARKMRCPIGMDHNRDICSAASCRRCLGEHMVFYRAEAARLRAEAANSAAQRDEAIARATQAEERLRAVEADLAELDDVFDLQWKADMRAVTEWRRKNPGNDLVLPDGCSLAVWALQQLDAAEAELARIRAADRTIITVRTTEAAKMRKGQAI